MHWNFPFAYSFSIWMIKFQVMNHSKTSQSAKLKLQTRHNFSKDQINFFLFLSMHLHGQCVGPSIKFASRDSLVKFWAHGKKLGYVNSFSSSPIENVQYGYWYLLKTEHSGMNVYFESNWFPNATILIWILIYYVKILFLERLKSFMLIH